MSLTSLADLPRAEKAVLGGQGQHLMAGGLDGPCFVAGNVPNISCHHALVAFMASGDGDQIGLRTAR